MALTPSQLVAELDQAKAGFEKVVSPKSVPVDSFGNQWTGKGMGAREVVGNPRTMPAPPSPNSGTSAIRAIPAAGAAGAGGSLGASLLGAATSPVALGAAGVAGALYPTKMGDGTINTPEAKKIMAENAALRANQPIQARIDALNMLPLSPPSKGATPPASSLLSGVPLSKSGAPIGDSALGATDIPSVTAPLAGQPAALPPKPSLLGAANYPNDNSISNLGDRVAAQDLANRTQGVLRATQGYQPISDAGSGGTMVRQQGATTDYQHPKGSMTFQGGAMGVPGRQGGGTLSFVGGRTPEEQAGIDDRVASINRQTEALRQHNIDTGRSYAPGSFAAPAAEPVNLFARPGDGFGDSQMRQAKFESLLSDAGKRGLGKNQRKAMVESAQALLSPGMGAAELQVKQQASRDSLLGQLTQAGATKNAAQLQAWQKMQEARERLGLDARKADQEQQIKGGELTLNALKTFQGMGEAHQQQAKADLYNAYQTAVLQGDQAKAAQLQPLMDYLYPQKQQNDTLAALLQKTPQ